MFLGMSMILVGYWSTEIWGAAAVNGNRKVKLNPNFRATSVAFQLELGQSM